MLYIQIKDITEEKYIKLIKYLFNRCDKFSFHMPNFNHSKSNFMNICKNDEGENDLEYSEYLENCNQILFRCKDFIISTRVDSKYYEQKFTYSTKIYNLRLGKSLMDIFENYHLLDWQYPALPEDPIFYSNGNEWLEIIGHEKISIIHNETKEDISFLNDMQIKYSQ